MADVGVIVGTAGVIVGIVGGGGGILGIWRGWRQESRKQHQDFWQTYEKQIAMLERQYEREDATGNKAAVKERLDTVTAEYHEQLEAYRENSALRQSVPSGAVPAQQPPLPEARRAELSEWLEKSKPLSPALLTADDHFARGNALARLKRYDEALVDFNRALELRPDFDKALYNWGNVLCDQADMKQGDEADSLFTLAAEKFQAALNIKPDFFEALNNLGAVLSDQAKMKQSDEADRLFALAAEKFQAALNIKPNLDNALYNWGTALSDQAKMKEGAQADRLFTLAAEKFQAALNIKPNLHEALYNWGLAFFRQANMKEGDEADRLFTLAAEKFQATLNMKPGHPPALYNRACVLSRMGQLGEALEQLRQAISRDGTYRKTAREDEDFTNLRSYPTLGPEFKRLVAEPEE